MATSPGEGASVEQIDLVHRESLEDRLRACLERGRLPDYFLYLGRGAENWLDLGD